MEQLKGRLTAVRTVSGSLTGQSTVGGVLSIPNGSYPVYSGEYTVTPKAYSETVLHTNGYLMNDDVTILEIPYWETSNITGTTIYIADEV